MSHKVTLANGPRLFSAWSTHRQEELTPQHYSRVIFLLHGFPDNNDSFHGVLPALERHFPKTLILAPLMRGYEPSSQGPLNEYCVFELAQDVRAWIAQVVPTESARNTPVHLVGHDWGAIVAFKTASKYPDAVTLVVTLAIPYLANLHLWQLLWHAPMQVWCLSYMLRMQSRLFYGPRFGNLHDKGYLDELWQYWLPGWDFLQEIGLVRATLAQPRVLDAATAYYRNLIPWKKLLETRWPVDFAKVPTLVLGGSRDQCMLPLLFRLEAALLAGTPQVSVKLVPGVGHFLHREDPAQIALLICDWFDRYP